MKNVVVTDDFAVCREADAILIDVQTPTDDNHVPLRTYTDTED